MDQPFLRKRRRLLRAALFSLCLALPGAAAAAPPELAKAEAAWHQGALEDSMALYEAALKKGGLEPAELVVAYARIGTVKAALKDAAGALSAFRTASTIDPEFELPADSGPLAKQLYDKARADAAAAGDYLSLELSAPETVRARRDFQVATVIPEAFSALVAQVEIEVTDEDSGRTWKKEQPIAPSLEFKVPAKLAVSGATLTVRARALDERRNTWVRVEKKVEVEGERATPGAMDSGREVSPFESEDPAPDDRKRDEGGGFWAGPTPWLVGGAAVVLVGVGAFFLMGTSSTAKVGAPAWR